METETLSPKVLSELNENSFVSTPEQDREIIESITKGNHLALAPKSKKTLPPKPLEKSKVDSVDESDDNGSYIHLHGNSQAVFTKIKKLKKNVTEKKSPKKTAVKTAGETAAVPELRKVPQPHTKTTANSCLKSLEQVISTQPSRTRKRDINSCAVTGHNNEAVKEDRPAVPTPPKTMKKVTKPSPTAPAENKTAGRGHVYNPIQVKSFMEQQREVRRIKEKKEQEERRLEAERKKKQLLELDSKRRDLISKTRIAPKQVESKDDHVLSLATKMYRARKAKSPGPPQIRVPKITHSSVVDSPINVQSLQRQPQNHRLAETSRSKSSVEAKISPSRSIERRDPSEVRSQADAQLRTAMLLEEFQSVVQRECLKLVSSKEPLKMQPSSTCNTEASKNLLREEFVPEDRKSGESRNTNRLTLSKAISLKVSSTDTAELQIRAATIIQSAYRGYKIRKIWREVSEQNFQRHPRRISFYRSRSLQPTDSVRRRLPLLSPVHSPIRNSGVRISSIRASSSVPDRKSRSAFGVTLDTAPYIPPPSPGPGIDSNIDSPRSSSITDIPVKSVPILGRPSLGRKSSRFDDLFPKEAIKQLTLQTQSPLPGGSPSLSDHFFRRDFTTPPVQPQVNSAFIPGISELFNPSVPTFSMVLKEKVRLLCEMHQSSLRKTCSGSNFADDRTPVKRNSMAFRQSVLSDNYDSDSTQHASIILSATNQNDTSSSDNTITDDYIGPGNEAMRLAYSLRKSPKISIEPEDIFESETKTDQDSNDTFPTSSTFTTNTGVDQAYVSTRRRRKQVDATGGDKTKRHTLAKKIDVVDVAENDVEIHLLPETVGIMKTQEQNLPGRASQSLDSKEKTTPDEFVSEASDVDRFVSSATSEQEDVDEISTDVPHSESHTITEKATVQNDMKDKEAILEDVVFHDIEKSNAVDVAEKVVEILLLPENVVKMEAQEPYSPGQSSQSLDSKEINALDESVPEASELDRTVSTATPEQEDVDESSTDTPNLESHKIAEKATIQNEMKDKEAILEDVVFHDIENSIAADVAEKVGEILLLTENVAIVEAQEQYSPGQSFLSLDSKEKSTLDESVPEVSSLDRSVSSTSEQEDVTDESSTNLQHSEIHTIAENASVQNEMKDKEATLEYGACHHELEKSEAVDVVEKVVGTFLIPETVDIMETQEQYSPGQSFLSLDSKEKTTLDESVSEASDLDRFVSSAASELVDVDETATNVPDSESHTSAENVTVQIEKEETALEDVAFHGSEKSKAEDVAEKDLEISFQPETAGMMEIKEQDSSGQSSQSFDSYEKNTLDESESDVDRSSATSEQVDVVETSPDEPQSESHTIAENANVQNEIKEKQTTLEEVAFHEISERSFSPPPPIDLTPTTDMMLDIAELAKYRDQYGFPERKPCRKWCVRERDIVDHVLVGEMLEENRSWIDLSEEISQVTDNLLNKVFRRAVASTLKLVSGSIEST